MYSVIGGLATIAIGWLCKIIGPVIVQWVRRDEPTLNTKYKSTFTESGKEFHETITVKQRGRKISGTIALREADDEEITTYVFEGEFRHLILTATYRSTDEGSVEQGAFVLKYKTNKLFIGHYIFFPQDSDEPISSEYRWAVSP